MIKLLQLECISYHTDFSLQAVAILFINKIHEITIIIILLEGYDHFFISKVNVNRL